MSQDWNEALVVLHPFGSYAKGDLITSEEEMSSVRREGHTAFVVPTHVPPSESHSAASIPRE